MMSPWWWADRMCRVRSRSRRMRPAIQSPPGPWCHRANSVAGGMHLPAKRVRREYPFTPASFRLTAQSAASSTVQVNPRRVENHMRRALVVLGCSLLGVVPSGTAFAQNTNAGVDAAREVLAKEAYVRPPEAIAKLVTAPRHLN